MRCFFEFGTYSGFPVVYITGDLDSATLPHFEECIAALCEGGNQCAILDLMDVAYSEAVVLRDVLTAHTSMMQRGQRLAVVCCAPLMNKLAHLVELDEQVPLFHSLYAAATYLSRRC